MRSAAALGLSALGLAALGSAVPRTAHASPNIVQDGGFETLTTGIWYVTEGVGGLDTDNQFVYAGHTSLYLTSDAGPDGVAQTLDTTAGQTYLLSFYADATQAPGTPLNTFQALFGGVPVVGLPTSITPNGFPSPDYLGNSGEYQFYQADVTAPSTSTVLEFIGSDPGNMSVDLDNISVTAVPNVSGTAVPEPSSFDLLGLALPALGLMVRRRARK